MASVEDPSDLESIFAACGVEPTISSAIIAEGWTKDLFAMCATSLVDLDAHIHELQPAEHEFSLREKACLRMAWKKCQEPSGPIEPAGDLHHQHHPHQVDGRKRLLPSYLQPPLLH